MKLLNCLIFIGFSFSLLAQKNIETVNSTFLIENGIRLHDAEDYEDALDQYQKVSINDSLYGMAQYEAALSLIKLERNEQAIQVLNDILLFQPKYAYKNQIYVLLGTAYENIEEYDKSIEAFKEGLDLFPGNHDLYYNMGVTYEKMKKYEEAVESYENAIVFYPNHASSHLQLAKIAANQEDYALAIVLYAAFLNFEGNTDRARENVPIVEKIANGSFDPEPVEFSFGEKAKEFNEINLLVKNKIALSNQFKSGLKLETDYGKQLIYILELLNEKNRNADKGEYLVRFKRIVDRNGLLIKPFSEALYHNSLQSLGASEVQAAIRKDQKDLLALYQSLNIENESAKASLVMDGVERNYDVYYNRSQVAYLLVPLDNITKETYAYDIYSNGAVRYKMKCLNESNFDCFGSGPFANGTISAYNYYDKVETANLILKNGQVDGVALYNYDSGELQYKKTFVAGKLTDTIYHFYRSGDLYEKFPLSNDLRNGWYETYYANGQLNYKMNYKDGMADGEFIRYFPNGKISRTFTTIKDEIDGEYINYFDNGQIESKYKYKDGMKNGPYEIYYKNGKLKEKGLYKNDNTAGEFEKYASNGTLVMKGSFDESGKENGVTTEYDIDGTKLYEFTFKKGDMINLANFKKDGTAFNESKKSGKVLKYEVFHSNGVMSAKGELLKNKKNGLWTYYDTYGNISGKTKYENGLIVDTLYSYHPNGNISAKQYYKNGERNGIYLEYDINGELTEEGIYENGSLSGDYYIYQKDGNMKEERFYYKGDFNGIYKTYAVNGKLISWSEYDMGKEVEHVFLDTNENVAQKFGEYNGKLEIKDPLNNYNFFSANYKNGEMNGTATWYYNNNQPEVTGDYINGYRDGKWTYYYPNGKVAKEMIYSFGDLDGVYTTYYENGQKAFVGTYENNSLQGNVSRYYRDGTIEMEDNYLDEERHGKIVYYVDNEISMIRYYKAGIFESYSYLDKNGNEVTPIEITNKENEITTYFKNGQKSTYHKRKFGLVEGEYLVYHTNGKLAEESNFRNGDRVGTFKEYDAEGKIILLENYQDDDLHGKRTIYSKNGTVFIESEFLYGERHGDYIIYDEKGKISKKHLFYDDKLISSN